MSEVVEDAQQITVGKDAEIEEFRRQARQLPDMADRRRCLRLIDKVEKDLRFNVEAEGKK